MFFSSPSSTTTELFDWNFSEKSTLSGRWDHMVLTESGHRAKMGQWNDITCCLFSLFGSHVQCSTGQVPVLSLDSGNGFQQLLLWSQRFLTSFIAPLNNGGVQLGSPLTDTHVNKAWKQKHALPSETSPPSPIIVQFLPQWNWNPRRTVTSEHNWAFLSSVYFCKHGGYMSNNRQTPSHCQK